MMLDQQTQPTQHRPMVHVALADPEVRSRVGAALGRHGWHVVEKRTGLALLDDLADIIEGKIAALPMLLVVDAFRLGVFGLTIAVGLRDLGLRIPLVLVARPDDVIPKFDDPMVRIAGPNNAVAAVCDIARSVEELVSVAGCSQPPAP